MKTELSMIAQALLQHLMASGGAWEQNCVQVLFRQPDYPPPNAPDKDELQCHFWQWEANCWGVERDRPVGNSTRLFKPTVELPFSRQIAIACQELCRAGLAGERNSGYNDYFFFAITTTTNDN